MLDTSVTIAGGQYRYDQSDFVIPLRAGTTYTLLWHTNQHDSTVTDSLFIDFDSLTVAPTVTIANQSRLAKVNVNVFPNDVFSPVNGFFLGMVNARLASAQQVLEPAPLALYLLGLTALGWARASSRRGGQ